MPIATINPATGETIRVFAPHAAAEVDRRLTRAAEAAPMWRATAVAERARVLHALGDLLDADRERLARIATLEMGKTVQSARDEVAKCAAACRWYAANGPAMLEAETVLDDESGRAHVVYEPMGVVLAVMPWNFPYWQVVRFLAPALVAGNVALLKHSSNVPQCALALEELARRAGAPEGVFQALLVGADAVADLIADDRVAAVTLTGSEGAGRSVAGAAGRALKKSVLELGGSDPFVVLPSADLAKAAEVAVVARTINNGQSCIAAKRFVVHRSVADEFTDRFVRGMRALRIGDPVEDGTQLGPLATASIREELHEQVERSVRGGARVLCGGEPLDGRGSYYAPTVLAEIPPDAPAARDELFGPVASLFVAEDLEDAVRVANATHFGLGASVWTTDPAEARHLTAAIQAGQVFVNAMVASDPRVPFGGIKRSGYGRELGTLGLREFVNAKTVRWGVGTVAVSTTE